MHNFVDESGTFCWTPEGVSVFAGLSTATRSLGTIETAFLDWKRKVLALPDSEEVKGASLTREQLSVFVKWVVLPHRNFWVTVVGSDTRRTRQEIVQTYMEQAAEVCEVVARQSEEAGNEALGRGYRQLAKWIRRRSPQNGLWLFVLARTILATLQDTVARHLEPADDGEFEDWTVTIDRTSVVETRRHERFWLEWLRNQVYQQTTKEPFDVPSEWAGRAHPFVRKYHKGDIVDMSDLIKNHMRFGDSGAVTGLQMADVCATIVRRRFSDEWWLPYSALRPRIVHPADGAAVHILQLDEASVRSGPPESCVRLLEVSSGEEDVGE